MRKLNSDANLFSIEIKNHINIKKQKAFEISIKLNFKDNDFKEYVLDYEDLKYLHICEGFLGLAILDSRGAHPGIAHKYCSLREIISGEQKEFAFQTLTQRTYFEQAIIKKLTKFLHKNKVSYLKIKDITSHIS